MNPSDRATYIRPLVLSLLIATSLEILNFAIFGLLLGHTENLAATMLWSVGVGGIGMGAVLGVLLDFIVVGQLDSREARLATLFLSTLLLGLVAKVATIYMAAIDVPLGLSTNPVPYFITGMLCALLGGYLLGQLLFTEKGKHLVQKMGL